jgi:hypothetical protein
MIGRNEIGVCSMNCVLVLGQPIHLNYRRNCTSMLHLMEREKHRQKDSKDMEAGTKPHACVNRGRTRDRSKIPMLQTFPSRDSDSRKIGELYCTTQNAMKDKNREKKTQRLKKRESLPRGEVASRGSSSIHLDLDI